MDDATVYPGSIVYFVELADTGKVKVGTSRQLTNRVSHIAWYEEVSTRLMASVTFKSAEVAKQMEKNIHAVFRKQGKCIEGEIFRLTPGDVGAVLDDVIRIMPERIERVERTDATRRVLTNSGKYVHENTL